MTVTLAGSSTRWVRTGTTALVAALVAGTLAQCSGGTGTKTPPTGASAGKQSTAPDPNPVIPAPATGTPVTCPAAKVTVRDANSLKQALAQAKPGDSIRMEDGVYSGRFVATTPATAAEPIFLCGGPGAVIDGGGVRGGYGFHLDGANYWRIMGFTVRNAQKGVMADNVQHAVIQGLTVEQIGDEGIHLRKFSSDNLVQGNTVRDTGLRAPRFGEGIYVGSAQSNWGELTGGKPDTSDRNVVSGNTISGTTAECVDIKEGTTGGSLIGNSFDGSRLSNENHADSWVDVKGNNWTIKDNIGRNSIADGFQTHEIGSGWGTDNVFSGNVAEVNGPGYGFNFTPVRGNRVLCDNKVSGGAKGISNVACS